MSAFEAVEMEVIVRTKIVSYYPKSVVENQVQLMRKINEALGSAGKDMYFLASPVSLTIAQGESK